MPGVESDARGLGAEDETATREGPIRTRGARARGVRPIGSARLTGPFWWQARGPVDVEARKHSTKIDALRAFASDPINARTLEEFSIYPDPSARARMYRTCSGEFDAVNERYDLKGPKKVCSIDDALWNLLPRRRDGFYVEDVDLDTLNTIAETAQTSGRFRMPEPIAAQLAESQVEGEAIEGAAAARAAKRSPIAYEPAPDYEAAAKAKGWPLTDAECEDESGRLVSCHDPDAKGPPVRVVYRTKKGTVYLEPKGPAVEAALEDRARRIALREMAEEAGGSFAFGLEGRAQGGKVDAGRAYLVGEEGPELFVPSEDGEIEPTFTTGAKVAFGIGALGLAALGLFVWSKTQKRPRPFQPLRRPPQLL